MRFANLPVAKNQNLSVAQPGVNLALVIFPAENGLSLLFNGRETFAWVVPDIAREHSIPCVLRVAGGTTYGVLLGTIPESLAQQLIEQYRKVDQLVSPARHMAEQLRSMGLNVKVIPNAIDLATFAPTAKNPELLRELKITDGNLVVAHGSNLKPLKRPLDIVRSAKEAIHQDPRLIYLIVGDGPCRQKMESLCPARTDH